jgi:hypothetical protein
MFLTITFDVVIAALILYRQRRIRPVPRTLHLRLPIFLGFLGLIEVLDYTGGHHISTGGFWLVLGATVVGAGLLGFVRALTVKIWPANHWVVRQGTWLTILLWVLSIVLHLTSGIGAAHFDAAQFAASSFLLYLALTLGVQAYVVHVRALPLWRALGPEAGQRVRVDFATGPAGAGAFFANFGSFGNSGSSGNFGNFGPAGPPFGNEPADDPTIIDAEVVEDEDPPALR